MSDRPSNPIARVARISMAIVAGVVICFSFGWVAARPWLYGNAQPNRVTLTIMHWGGKDEDAIIADLVREFEARNPGVHVERINPGWTHFSRKLQTMMAAGDPPDVFYLGNDFVPKFAGMGLLTNVEPMLEADVAAGRDDLRVEDFYQPVLNSFRFDGTTSGRGPLYGLPKDFTNLGIYYNKELFRRAGLDYPADDWTWDDFIAAARAIGQLDSCYGAEFGVGYWVERARPWLWTLGLDFASDDFRELYVTDPELIAALETVRRWRFEEGRTLAPARSRVQAGAELFMTGRVGMYGPLGRWVVPEYRRLEDLDWEFAALPRGRQRANIVFTTAWTIASRTRYPKESWELVRFLCGPVGQRMNAQSGLAIPSLRTVAESDAFLDPERKPERDDLFVAMVPDARLCQWPEDRRYIARARDQFEACLKFGTKSVPSAMEKLDSEWRKLRASPLNRTGFPSMPWGGIALWSVGLLAAFVCVVAWRWWCRRPGRRAFREELAGMAFVSPWAIGFLCITLFPIALSLLLAFTKWNGILTLDHAEWVGLGNFRELVGYDDLFRQSLAVTAYYAVLAVPLSQIAALLAALLMNTELRGIGLFRSAWYLPSVLAGVGVAVLWRWVFDGEHGLLNWALATPLAWFGVRPPDWLGGDARLLGPPAFAIMHLWIIGGSMMIYLAGLNGIPKTLYEAAELDGAGHVRRFCRITLPMLSPVIFFNGIMAIIASFQVFTQAFVMTDGGPDNATMFYVLYLYKQAFEFHEMGYASAMAWLLLLIILGLTLLVMRGSRRYVHYEGLRV